MARSNPPPSEPPPSSLVPGRSGGGGAYIAGIAAFALLIGGLVVWKMRTGETAQPPPPPVVTTSKPVVDGPFFAPPPPPPEDAGAADASDAGEDKKDVPAAGPGQVGGPGPCTACGKGDGTPELSAAVRARAGMARGCYNQTLKHGGAEGAITVSVSIGNTGAVCGVRVASDTVHNASLSSCIVGKFQAASYPKPKRGCVVVNVPISFKMK